MSFKQPLINPATNSSFEVVAQVNDDNTGFSATVFKDTSTGEYVIAFRGTELTDMNDLRSNKQMFFDLENPQFDSARNFVKEKIAEISFHDPDAKISLTGHSLGGTLAQLIAYENELEALTFNAYGGKDIIKKQSSYDESKFNSSQNNVHNFILATDVIAVSSEQYGNTYVIETKTPIVSHGIKEVLSHINPLNDEKLENIMKKPVDITALRDMLKAQQDLIYGAVDYYSNLTYDKFVGDLKYIGEMLFDELFGDTLNISLYQPYDPIALDLNNNGKIDTLSLENGVFFDHNGDKVAFKSSWVNSSDGILARDIDGDGKITSGAELFGNFTRLKNGELAKNGTEAGEIILSDRVKISA